MSYIYVGRLDKLKGIKVLFEAWRRMGKEAPELKVCGSGALENWCREYITQNNLTMIFMLGFISNIEVKKLIANSQALILPTQLYEGFPMTILEAYSVGTPVIASDLGNAGSIVEEYSTGLRFKYDSPDSLMKAVKKFESLQDINWKENILDIFQNKYSSKKNYKILSAIYDRVCQKYKTN